MKTSQAARSLLMSSHERMPVSSSSAPPSNAVTVMSILVQDELTHKPQTNAKMAETIFSRVLKRPILRSSSLANAAASGVSLSSGGFSFITTQGMTSNDSAPGTIAAEIQLSHVTL